MIKLSPKMKKWLVIAWIVVSIIIGLTTLLMAFLWFRPLGGSEYRISPDGRFTATAYNMSTGKINGDRDWYIELTVVENANQRVVWHVVHRYPPGVTAPDYSMRGTKFVVWSADSSTVTVPVSAGNDLVLPVQ